MTSLSNSSILMEGRVLSTDELLCREGNQICALSPHSPAQNEISEREDRTLFKNAHSAPERKPAFHVLG